MQAPPCCTDVYSRPWAQALLGESFHPGGSALTERLLAALALPPGALVLDVASGAGATALLLAERGHQVVGLELSSTNVAGATRRAHERGLSDRVHFIEGDLRALPFAAACFNAVFCECTLSMFAEKAAPLAEISRVLCPGGVVAFSDMVRAPKIAPALLNAAGPWACLQGALSVAAYTTLFAQHGLMLNQQLNATQELSTLVVDLKRRLLLGGIGAMAGALKDLSLDFQKARQLLDTARDEIAAKRLGYAALLLRKPLSASDGGESCDA